MKNLCVHDCGWSGGTGGTINFMYGRDLHVLAEKRQILRCAVLVCPAGLRLVLLCLKKREDGIWATGESVK